MASIGLFEAKAKLSEIVRKAEQGEVTTITVNGKPMAQVVPLPVPKAQFNEEEREAAFQRLMHPRIKGISGEEVLAAIRGRPTLSLVLDASMALAWLITRANPLEADLAREAFGEVQAQGGEIPSLWHAEIANTLLVFERAKKLTEQDSSSFLSDLRQLNLKEDEKPFVQLLDRILDLGRRYGLTAYDSVYLELALRTGRTLATFDRQLADAVRKAGGRVFGDVA